MVDEDAALFDTLGSPATRYLGTELLSVDRTLASAQFRFLAREEFANAYGQVQGGFIAAMLDETAGLTARLISNGKVGVPSLDFRVTFFTPARVGYLLGIGRCLRAGRRIIFLEADLHDEQSRLLSRMSCTALAVNWSE